MQRRSCPDCHRALHPINLIDSGGAGDQSLQYAAADAQRHWFSGQIPKAGIVRGYLCEACGRILLYGHPKDQSLPIPTASRPEGEES
jgi:hypothetical protein